MAETTHKDQEAWDVLTTALEGGFAEEFEVVSYERSEEHDHVITTARLFCSEHAVEGVQFWTVDAKAIRRGFQRFTAWVRENDPAHRSYLGEQWAIAHDEDAGWDELDAIGADAVLQFACFGEVIFD